MRAPIRLAEIYAGIERVSPQLTAPAQDAANVILKLGPPGLLRLCFLPLYPGEPVEVHGDSLYARAATYMGSQGARPASHFWIAFSEPHDREHVTDVPETEVQRRSTFATADLLEAFHFCAPLTCTSEMRLIDPELDEQIAALQQLRPICGAQLHGKQLSLRPPVIIACAEPDTLRLSSLAPLDSPPSGHMRYPMAGARSGLASFVVLDREAITLDPDPTMRLTCVS